MANTIELSAETTAWLDERDAVFDLRALALGSETPVAFAPLDLTGVPERAYTGDGVYSAALVQEAIDRLTQAETDLNTALSSATSLADQDAISARLEVVSDELAVLQEQLAKRDQNGDPVDPATPPRSETTKQVLDLYRGDSPSEKVGMDEVAALSNQINLMEGFAKMQASRAQRLVHLIEHHRSRLFSYQPRSIWLRQALLGPNQVRARYVSI